MAAEKFHSHAPDAEIGQNCLPPMEMGLKEASTVHGSETLWEASSLEEDYVLIEAFIR